MDKQPDKTTHSSEPDFSGYPHLAQLRASVATQYPFLKKVFEKRFADFGVQWAQGFDLELKNFFGQDEDRVNRAAKGYGVFAIDAMRLQKQFDKTREYIFKNYADVANDVYLNKEYMFGLYLPGIFVSQYLWFHHYQQLRFFWEHFVPLAKSEGVKLFHDVGVGTGFYSKEMLRALPEAKGIGFDISPFSLEHAQTMVKAWGLESRYATQHQDILVKKPETVADAIINVEVLEHLENPDVFLGGLCGMLKTGGLGFVTAAVNAPNADHIYLYRSIKEVTDQVEGAGFKVLEAVEFFGYEPRPGESVPSSVVLIVRKS